MARLVDNILLAEFDIEKGSTVSMQYPEPTGTELNILAELMLPDGAHNRDQDWTIFFLNQTLPESAALLGVAGKGAGAAKEPPVKQLEGYVYLFTEATQGWEMLGTDKKKLRLEPDQIHICEADGASLRKIVRNPGIQFQQMEPLYDAIITDDVALGIRFNDEGDEAVLLEFLKQLTEPALERKKSTGAKKEEEPKNNKPFLYVLNLVRTKHIPGVKRGARTKAMAICTQHQFLHIYKPLLLLALDKFFDTPDVSVLQQLYDAVNAMELSGMPRLTEQEKKIVRASEGQKELERRSFSTKVRYNGIDIPMRIPIAMFPDEVGDFSLIKLVNKFGNCTVNKNENGVMVILNALLRQQRIIFLGHNLPSGEVANYVLAAISMMSPPLRGFTERAFPYTNLSNVDNVLSFPGFIAGVTNPRFEDLDKWWDVLCNVGTGTVKLASHLPPQTQTDPHVALDQDFIADVMFAIQSHYSEDRIRAKFQEYVQGIVDTAFDDAEYVDDAAKKKAIAANQKRVELWKCYNGNPALPTESWIKYNADRNAYRETRAIKDADVARLISRLRVRQSIPEKDILSMYTDFVKNINTDEQLIEFLSYLPENQGGLYPVAVSLFHPSESVRRSTVELFKRIDKLKAGSGFINGMNQYLRLAFERNKELFDH